MSELRLQLLGAPVAEVGGDPVVVDTRKAIALLAYLAVEKRPFRRDWLAGLLWPDYETESARGALRRTLSSLKRGLRGGWLVVDRSTVSLEQEGLWLDVAEFVAAAEDHDHSPAEPCELCEPELGRVALLYRGDFMEGFSIRDSPEFEDWQLRWADNLRHTLSETLERLLEIHSSRGDFSGAAEHARRWLALDPLHEPAHRRLIHLYALQGRRSDALRQYRECVAVLEKELGVGPLPETTELYETILREAPAPETPAEPASPGEALPAPEIPLVGRAPELRAMKATLEQAAAGGRLVVIQGEAGIGKSRLAEEFLAAAGRAGSLVAGARCYQEETDLAYAPIAEAVRSRLTQPDWLDRLPARVVREAARLVPELSENVAPAPHVEGPGGRRSFLDAVTESLFTAVHGVRPGILFFDDLHWADESSVDILAYAIRRLSSHRALVVVTWRTEGMPPEHRLRRLAAEMRAGGTSTSLALSRLDREQVTSLVSSAVPALSEPLEMAGRLFEETEGLPFFVVEYLAALRSQEPFGTEWTLPAGAADLLESRVASVSELGRQVLTAAATVGRSFDFDILKEASGRSDDETVNSLEELIRGGLVREIGPQPDQEYDFSHEQLRAFVYRRAGLARLRLLHRRIAESLVRRPESRSDGTSGAALIARHYRLGGADEEAARYFALAGQQAAAVYANLEALAHFESALALGHTDVPSIREAIGDVCTLLGRYREALTAYEIASSDTSDSHALGVLQHKLGQVEHRRGAWEAAESHYQAALDLIDVGELELAARIHADRSLTARLLGNTDEAIEHAERALELAELAGDAPALARAHNILGIVNGDAGRPEAARSHLETSLELAEQTGDVHVRIAALNNLALFHRRSGNRDVAIDLTKKGLALCASLGDRHREAALHNNLADLLREAGEIDEALQEQKIAVAMFSEVGAPGELEPEIWKLVDW